MFDVGNPAGLRERDVGARCDTRRMGTRTLGRAPQPGGGNSDAVASFHPAVREWFARTFPDGPTDAQDLGWAEIGAGRHTLIAAPTGSGKTLAAFLWAIDHLHRQALDGRLEDRVHVVYVSPLRALNNDVEKKLRTYNRKTFKIH